MEGWSAEDVVAAIYAKRITLRDLDRRASLPLGTVSATIHKPNAPGEQAVSTFLGIQAHVLWPSRYSAQGKRLDPQPRANYSPARRFKRAGE